jgi:hypothetical protein
MDLLDSIPRAGVESSLFAANRATRLNAPRSENEREIRQR